MYAKCLWLAVGSRRSVALGERLCVVRVMTASR